VKVVLLAAFTEVGSNSFQGEADGSSLAMNVGSHSSMSLGNCFSASVRRASAALNAFSNSASFASCSGDFT
jgi:hypothetical protein